MIRNANHRGARRSGPFSVMVALALCVSAPLDSTLARAPENGELSAPEVPADFGAVQIAGPFEFPWSIAVLPNGSILLTERVGRLQLIRPGSSAREITGVPPVLFSGHSGLLDVSVDPGFGENGIIYLSYVHGTGSSSTIRVLRAKLDEPRSKLKHKQVIFESSPPAPSPNQLGGRIAVTGDGYLFLTLGDRWEGERAQDLADHAGSIIRIRTDGSVPWDNPFVSLPEAKPEIWSYGHRNPQGLAFHARSGQLWSHEHGPKGGDELNLIISGRNYGWPVITHGIGYADEPIGEGAAKHGMEQPVYHWTPSIAPSGLALEGLDRITGFWIGALAGEALVNLDMKEGRIASERRFLRGELGRIRDVRVDSNNLVYFVTDGLAGEVYRLEPVVEQAHQEERRRR
ncbi:glucose/arabinose dehydrogenase [Bradyrhizobium sp. AZCC 1578]|jgi:aldose sugar dehydrogenase|uniref:PQQ-dependent sugar dehydrogenase n=1 Tax=unclassified Bradyrhizobium TaxID=2631580 RepID=UPI002FF30C21